MSDWLLVAAVPLVVLGLSMFFVCLVRAATLGIERKLDLLIQTVLTHKEDK